MAIYLFSYRPGVDRRANLLRLSLVLFLPTRPTSATQVRSVCNRTMNSVRISISKKWPDLNGSAGFKKKCMFTALRGQGGPRPKIIFNVTFVEGRQSYQMLFTGSKNIDPSRIYRIFKIAKYIQLPCGRALYSRLSQNFKF